MKVLIFDNDEINSLYIESLLENAFQTFITKFSQSIEILEEMIWDYEPDIFFVHCHTESRDFERIRELTKKVFQLIPKCIVIVTYHPEVNNDYKETYLIGYSYDLMLPKFLMTNKDIDKVKIMFQKKQHTTLF